MHPPGTLAVVYAGVGVTFGLCPGQRARAGFPVIAQLETPDGAIRIEPDYKVEKSVGKPAPRRIALYLTDIFHFAEHAYILQIFRGFPPAVRAAREEYLL